MSDLPQPPADPGELAGFPVLVWPAQQPLWRIHRRDHATVHFAADPDGRFNPPSTDAGFGTWYVSSHARGAFVEVFGRFRVITRTQVAERVLAIIYPPSDLRLADLTNPRVIGEYGLTNELSMGEAAHTYQLAQRWARALWQAGYAGVHCAARHDTELLTRSVAIFGKPDGQPILGDDDVLLRPLDETAAEMADHYGFTIIAGLPL